jgi:hypothetical protein
METPIKVGLTLSQEKIANQLIKEYYLAESDFKLEIKNKATLLIKLLQISDGFLRDGEGNYLSIESNKLSKLIHLVTELLESGERVLVWFNFRQSIKEAIAKSSWPTVVLSGDDEFDREAWNKGKAKVCYATIGSGSSINDFANVRYAIIYSPSFSYRAWAQAKGRTLRKSSTHPIAYYYYLQTLGMPDEFVYETLELSQNVEDITKKVTDRVLTNWLAEKAIWDSM